MRIRATKGEASGRGEETESRESLAAGRITNHFPGPRNPANWLKSRSWPCRNIGNLSPAYTGEDRAREKEISKDEAKERGKKRGYSSKWTSRAHFSPPWSFLLPLCVYVCVYGHLFIFPSRCSLSPRHFGSPRRCSSSSALSSHCCSTRQGKQCLISVNAAIMAPSSLHRPAELRRREREISEICAGARHIATVYVSIRMYTYTHTYIHTHMTAATTGALDYRLAVFEDFITGGDPCARLRMCTIICDRREGKGAEQRSIDAWSSDHPTGSIDRSIVISINRAHGR